MDGILIILVICYFFPTIVAILRRHSDGIAIFLVNLFLGWTIAGWFKALVWSFTATQRKVAKLNASAIVKALDSEKRRGF
jgi:Superinfection immunity protein